MRKNWKRMLSLVMALSVMMGTMNLSAWAVGDEEIVHEHDQLNCETCGGTGEIEESIDMTPYEDAYAEFEVMAVEDNSQSTEDNALQCLEDQGVDITDPFAVTYAKYMVKAGDNAWSVNEILTHGPLYDLVLNYEGDGTEESALANLEKYKPVPPVKTAGKVDCPDCEDGTVACDGEFTPGELVKNDDGTGTVTYTCETCGASYEKSRTHEEVVAELGDEGHIMSTDATEHQDATCTEDGYNKYTCAVEGCDGEAVETIPATGHSKPTEGIEITKEATCGQEGELSYTCTVCGETVTEAIPAKEHKFNKNHVCANCGAVKVTVYGVNMGYWYGYVPSTAEDYRAVVLGKDEPITANNVGFGAHEGRGEFVTNYSTNKAWQLVGFLPETTSWGNRQEKLAANYVYTNSEQPGKFKTCEGLDEVKAYVENNGVLYGNPVPEAIAGDIAAVWFIEDAPVKPGQFGEYPLDIEPFVAPALKENSTGVSIGVDPDSVVYVPASGSHAQGNYVRGSYTVDMVIRIDRNAPNDVHVNIVPGLAAAADVINRTDGFQPGDAVILNISIDNQSGKAYSYVPGSGFVATNPDANDYPDAEVAGTGFDGFQIPVVDNSQYSYIARRIDNVPLKDLGLTNNINDEAVGAALANRGYGKDEGLTNEQIAQTYLAHYYLDWTNAARTVRGEAPAGSFQDMTLAELAVFTNGSNNVQVFESCEDVVEGLYYFYYGAACTYNGKTIYQQMVDYKDGVSELETAIPAALNDGNDYDFNTLNLSGDYVNNSYQNTQFSFRMEFDLSYTPTPPTPTPTYTSLTVNKIWAGDDDTDVRPGSVTVQLYRDGTASGRPYTLNDGNDWSHTWNNLNDAYTWTVGEVDVPEGYTSSTDRDGTVVTITNTYTEPIPTPTVTPEPTPEPVEELEEPDVPLADLPKDPEEFEELEEPDVPLANVPQTGDAMFTWASAAALSGLGLAFLSRKKKEDEA